ncbi:uncharacterized protein LOC124261329 isoform X2 [Haliotis rubra]|uniref:uncharacterized protein LOC124261329 isoform X2 n=1 Tax=Haliotis rubra TaxID=36100 RepID=UPI001EE55BA2|nr:uncharacterized protein LOC124261329 isoform X2 [Haliotis rubra]
METLPRQVTMVSLFLLICFVSIFVSDAAETSTSCPEVACFGRPVNITCDITGQYDSIGFSRRDAIEVVTCLKNKDKCYFNVQGYEVVLRSDDKHIMRIKSLNKTDVGTWNCRDGTKPLLKTCSIEGYDVRQSPTPAPPSPDSDNCIHIPKTFRPQTLCEGFQEDANVNITIRMAENSYSFTSDQYKENDEVELDDAPTGGELECSVTGPAAQCYTPSNKKTKICSHPPVPPWGIALIVFAIVIIIIIIVLVDCFCCRPKDKGVIHFVEAKLKSRKADVTTAGSEKEKPKTEGGTAETDSPPETKPLLDMKTTKSNSQMTVENETEKAKELEPEDKDGGATEPKSKDKDADTTGNKTPDKGADTTGDKTPDKGPAVLVVQSENKQAT